MKLYEIDYYNIQDLVECNSTTHEQFNDCAELIFEGSLANCFLKIENICKENDWHYEKNDFSELVIRNWNNHLQVTTYFNGYPEIKSKVYIITNVNNFKVIDENNILFYGFNYAP